MEFSKESKISLKKEIKVVSEAQKDLRNQRKTVHIQGERILDPEVAARRHSASRWWLRHAYIAYSIIRCKDVQKPKDGRVDHDLVATIIEKHAPEPVHTDQEGSANQL